jgi:Raf kinase inhibitor-like YbhB/YbcL family protein
MPSAPRNAPMASIKDLSVIFGSLLALTVYSSSGCGSGNTGAPGGGSGGTSGSSIGGRASGSGGSGTSGNTSNSGGSGTGGSNASNDGGSTSGSNTGGSGGAEMTDASTAPSDAATMNDAPVGNGPFALSSSAVMNNGIIPVMYRCTGTANDTSPPLSWTPGPAGTLSYALTLWHGGPTAPGDVHWAIYDIPATTTSLPSGVALTAMPANAPGAMQLSQTTNSPGWFGYGGICPAGPDQVYTFTLYALKVATLSAASVTKANLKASALASATLVVMASKGGM